ncbi:MAG: GAF domain-containing protein [Crocinitomicaceae bacterium]|nr:GAF domain-containing protein [Crocinitomicaceae bacterium]
MNISENERKVKRINDLIQRSLEIHRTDPSEGKKMAQEALELSEELNYHEGWARGYYALGASSIWLSEYDNALTYSLKALTLLQEEGLAHDTVEVLYNISITYYLIDDLDNALKYAQKCFELSEKIHYDHGKAMGINAKACVLYTDNRNDEAVDLIAKGLKYAEHSDDIEIRAKLMDGLGQAYFNIGDYDKAFQYKSECLEIVRSLKSMGTVAFALDGIGMIQMKRGKLDAAFHNFEEALKIRQEIGFVAGEANSYLHIGLLKKKQEDNDSAEKYYTAALELGKTIGSLKIQYKAYHYLADLCEIKEDLKGFSVFYKQYHETKEKFLRQHIQKKYKTRELIAQMEQVDSERILLTKKNDELKKYSNDIRILSEIGKELTSTLNFDEILERVYNQVNSVMDASVFLIAMYTEDTNTLSFEYCVEKDVRMPDVRIQLDENDGRLATYVVRNKKEVIINNYHEDIKELEGVNPGVLAGEMPESIIYMPILFQDQLLGLISVQSFVQNAYSSYDIDLLRNLSVYAAIALKNAVSFHNVEEQVKERTKEIEFAKEKVEQAYSNTKLIGELGQKLISTFNLDEVIMEVYEMMNQLMKADYFGLNIYDDEKGTLDCVYSIENNERQEPIEFQMDDDTNLSVWSLKNNQDLFIENLDLDAPKYIGDEKLAKVIRGGKPECCIFIPLIKNGEQLGVLTTQSFDKGVYSPYEYNILKSISTYFLIALENARSYERMEKIVERRTLEVRKQKEIIEEKNKSITDSIKYAKRLQEAILPPQTAIERYEKTSFVLYKPKDIVSGDFYWMEEQDEKIIFAVVDCTGHGVPGAFMSIIGYNGLYQIVKENGITKPAEILNQLNHQVLNILRQTESSDSVNDGMDIAICCLNKKTQILEFAGAFNPLYHIREGKLAVYKGDKYSVGSVKRKKDKDFTNHEIQLQSNDHIYIFSDGYADQFGGPEGKKYKYQDFRKLLIANCHLPMSEQREILDQTIEDWMGEEDQVDDICVIGVRF